MNFENNIPENESFEETVQLTQTMDNLESENISQAQKAKKKKSIIIFFGLGFIVLIVFLLIFTGSSDSSGSSGSSSSYKSSYSSDDRQEALAIEYVKRGLADRIEKDAYKYGGDVSSIKYTIASTNRTGSIFVFYGRISLYDKYGNYIDTKNFTAEVDLYSPYDKKIEIN